MNTFDEYRFFAESTEKLSERRQASTQTYLAVNTAIFAVLAFLIKDAGFRGWGLVAISVPLFLVGFVACVIWYNIIRQYKELIAWRYERLIELEGSASMGELTKFYSNEKEKFYKPVKGKEKFGFSRLEIWLPGLFMGLYAIYAILIIAGTALGVLK